MAEFQNYGGFTTPTPVPIGTQGSPNWGSTFLGDLVTRPEFKGYTLEEVFNRCDWVQSGIIARNSALDCREGGVRITLPMYRPFEAEEERIESNATWGISGAGYLTPQKINAVSSVVPIFHRGFSAASDELAGMGSGTDPLAAIQSYIASSMRRNRTRLLGSMLNGVFGSALAANAVSVARTTGALGEANTLTAGSLLRARNVLGERGSSLTVLAAHSAVINGLIQTGLMTFSTSSISPGAGISWGGGGVGIGPGAMEIGTFAGCRVVQDDTLAPITDPVNGDVFPVYIFAPGAVQEGVQRDFRLRYDTNILSFQDILVADYHGALAIPGVTWQSGTDNPDNTDYATPGNYGLVYSTSKLVPLVRLSVNSAFAVNP